MRLAVPRVLLQLEDAVPKESSRWMMGVIAVAEETSHFRSQGQLAQTPQLTIQDHAWVLLLPPLNFDMRVLCHFLPL